MQKPFQPIIIVAVDQNGGFGEGGRIPWHLPEDLQRFKKTTEGHICVMGRRTYVDILEARKERDTQRNVIEPIDEILRRRSSFVVTSDDLMETPGAIKIKGMHEVLHFIEPTDQRQIFVIGGRRMFIEALSLSKRIIMTIIKNGQYNCDVFFPVDVLNKKWKIVSGEETENAYFVEYNRQ